MTPLLAVAHGSQDPASQRVVADLLAGACRLRPGLVARAAFIDNAGPSVRSALNRLAADGVTDLVVLPLLLTAAAHSKTDVAASVRAGRGAHASMRVRYGRPLGADPVVVRVLDRRLREAGADPDLPVLLVAGGALDPDANASVASVARLLLEHGHWPTVDIAFASTAAPTVPAALARLGTLGHRRVAVARYFLGPGRLPALVDRLAGSVPGISVIVGDVLGVSDDLAGLVLSRYDEAVGGGLRMPCDTCMYRVALPGRGHLVGAPQTVHRHPDDVA